MGGDGPTRWTGRRDPNTSLAWGVIAIGTGLLAVVAYQVAYQGAEVEAWAVVLIVVAMVAYGAISFTSHVEVEVALRGEELVLTRGEWSLGRLVRESSSSLDRSRMTRVVERNAGLGIRVVRFEDAAGRRLLTFPEFLGADEHDAMMAAILEWGDQAPSSAGPEDVPLPISR